MENQEKYNNLSKLVEKLKKSEDPKRKYEYILWLGKKLKEPDSEILVDPYSAMQTGVTAVRILQAIDIKVRHAESFGAIQDITT